MIGALNAGFPINCDNGLTDMNQEISSGSGTERVPVMQRILDNPFILLFLGVVLPTVFFIVWGIMEIISIPIAK